MAKLIENTSIVKRNPNDKVYCHEPYAQELYEKYSDYWDGKTQTHGDTMIAKDFRNGDIVKTKITKLTESYIEADTGFGQMFYLDYTKESRFFIKHGIDPKPGIDIEVMVTDASASLGSAEKAFSISLRRELQRSITENNSAYIATIKSINDGGFLVDLNGISCFMPGSLAAANKINDFESMINKQVYVMVENYLDKSDMFVVSVKKYIKHILPLKLKDIDYTAQYTGQVTGVAEFGVFVEWDEIFTGLLHETETGSSDWSNSKPGDEISFYIKEVRDNNRIILSQKGPNPEVMAYTDFKEKYEGEVFANAEVKDIKAFGVFIKMGDVTGMMAPKEFKKYSRLSEGDFVDVLVKQVDITARRIYLRVPEPDVDVQLEGLKNAFRR